MPPEVTAEEWDNMAQAATQPGIHHQRQGGFRERLGSIAGNLRDRKILGRPAYEMIADFGAGFAVKTAVRSGVMLAGASTLGAIGAAVLAGAASGAVFAGGKEWFRQAQENWKQPLPPEAITTKQQILERLNGLTPNDWKRLGHVTLRGAVVGAAFGFAGGLVADVLHAAGSAPVEDNLASTPVSEPTAVQSSLIPTETAVPDHIVTPTPDVDIPVTPTVDTQPLNPDLIPTHPADIPSTTSIPDTSASVPTVTPDGSVPIPPDVSQTPPGAIPATPTEVAAPAEVTVTPTPFVEASPVPLPTETATPFPDGSSLTPEASTAPSLPTATPVPDTSASVPTVTPDGSVPVSPDASSSVDVPGAPPTDLPPGAPAEGITVPPVVEQPIVPPMETFTESVNNLKDIPLAAGSNPWQVATEILKQVDPNHVPSNAEIMEVTRAICEQNDISVPEWGISGSVDEHRIPVGYLLKIDPEVKSVIFGIVKGG
ncbi:hypothetical protein HYU95_03960 [Candidatus Daviesbacteria bacterium]|nr:hypothetical protein [Candidatus Daviesbacteria bacterium]